MGKLFINYDEGPNGDYMAEAERVAAEMTRNGDANVRVWDRGNGAMIEWGGLK